MKKLLKAVARELFALLPVWLFFYLAFSLLRMTQMAALADYGVHSTATSLVLLGSLIVAKAFLLLRHRRLMNLFINRPLIYGVLWKTLIYDLGVFVILSIEQFLEFLRPNHSFSAARHDLFHLMASPRFWVMQLWVVLLLFVFSSFQEIIQLVGRDRFLEAWFGRKRRDGDSQNIRKAS